MTAVSELPSPRSGEHTLAVAVGLVSFVALYLTSGAIDNDHFVIYARAMQVLGGDWPVRDFEDPGMPVAYLAQALVAWVFGASLLVNVVFSVALIALTAGLTYLLAARACGQRWLALVRSEEHTSELQSH